MRLIVGVQKCDDCGLLGCTLLLGGRVIEIISLREQNVTTVLKTSKGV